MSWNAVAAEMKWNRGIRNEQRTQNPVGSLQTWQELSSDIVIVRIEYTSLSVEKENTDTSESVPKQEASHY